MNTITVKISFLQLVRKMRTTQKDYFTAPTPRGLADAKRLEREVDQWLEQNAAELKAYEQLHIEGANNAG